MYAKRIADDVVNTINFILLQKYCLNQSLMIDGRCMSLGEGLSRFYTARFHFRIVAGATDICGLHLGVYRDFPGFNDTI